MSDHTQARLIVVPIIKDDTGRVLICKMPRDRGAFPAQWGLAGGGVDPLVDVNNASRRAGVMVRGRWYSEGELRKMLEEMSASNSKAQNQ